MADDSVNDTLGAAGKARGARGRKQRILWDSDNVTPDGKTSIGILLEWLTAPGNYERWQDGKAQFGETREKLCTEINTLMRKSGITHRENANIRTQISELERSYDAAVAWLVQAGFENGHLPELSPEVNGAKANAPSTESSTYPIDLAEAQVLRLCRYYHVLSVIMRQPSNQPRVRRSYQRSASSSSRRLGSGSQKDDDSAGEDDFGMDHASDSGDTPLKVATLPQKRKASTPIAASSSSAAGNGASAASPLNVMNSGSFANFENTQRMIMDAAREDRERKRFQMDEDRTKLECEKLRYEIQLKKMEVAVQRVLARKQLLDAGVPAGEVDSLLTRASAQ